MLGLQGIKHISFFSKMFNIIDMRYKHFLFDADNTIFDYRQGEKNAFNEIARIYNLNFDDAVLDTYHKINKECWKAYERGELPQDKLLVLRFKNLCDELDFDIEPYAMDNLFTELLSKQTCLMPYAKQILDILRDEECKIQMITNGVSETQYGRLKATGLESYFENIFVSSEMGCQKPDIEYFDIVLDKINAKSDECIIIGDRLESDILGGLKSNIDTIWLNTKQTSNMDEDIHVKPTYEIDSLSKMMELIR